MTMRFDKTEEGMALMAAYVSGLVRGAVAFTIEQFEGEVLVKLTGGF